MDSVKFNETNGADENEKKASSAEFPIEEEEEEGEMALKSASNHNDNSGRSAGSSLRRLFRRDSVRAISKRNMRHPRDMDVCHGSNTHPGTQAWMEAVLKAVHKSEGKAWSQGLYKGILKDLSGRRFFLKDQKDGSSPWREATPAERVSLTKTFFEAKRRERRG